MGSDDDGFSWDEGFDCDGGRFYGDGDRMEMRIGAMVDLRGLQDGLDSG